MVGEYEDVPDVQLVSLAEDPFDAVRWFLHNQVAIRLLPRGVVCESDAELGVKLKTSTKAHGKRQQKPSTAGSSAESNKGSAESEKFG